MKSLKKQYNIIIVVLLTISFLGCGIWYLIANYRASHIKSRFSKQIERIYNNIEVKGKKFVFDKNNQLIYWQDNTIPIDSTINRNDTIIELKNGYYLHKIFTKNGLKTHYLYRIKNKYNVTNNFVDNSFATPLKYNEDIIIASYETSSPIVCNGNIIGYLDFSPECLEVSKKDSFIFKLWLCINIFVLTLFILSGIRILPRKKQTTIPIIILLFIAYTACAIFLLSRSESLSFKLFTTQINYDNILSFSILVALGFIVYWISEKLLHINRRNKYAIFIQLGILLLISIIGGATLEIYSNLKSKDIIESKANSLLSQKKKNNAKDFVLLMNQATKDSTLVVYTDKKDYNAAEKYINKYYLSLLKDANHTGVLVFDKMDSMTVQPQNTMMSILSYVQSNLRVAKKITTYNNLYVQEEADDNNNYIYFNKIGNAYIFAECMKKINSKNMNYSLILDKEDANREDISFAKYVGSNLIYSDGERNFPLRIKRSANGWKAEGNYTTYYKTQDNTTYAVCSKAISPYNILGAISMFFLVLMALFGIEKLIEILPNIKKTPSIKSSILIALLSSFIISLIILGFSGIRSINNLNRKNNTDILKDKTLSIQFEIENLLTLGDPITENTLINLSNTFLTDINIFDNKGNLVATSQRTIFEKGYLLDKMNAQAFKKMRENNANLLYQKEKICKSEFLSSYCPIQDAYNNVYYLNIPFIYQQKTMNDNINNLINNFANMFLFWVNIAIMIFVLLSNVITKPLDIVKKKLSRVNLDSKNEKIKWDKDDEMGDLIKSYNQMIDKIEESSLLLKQQERESSWRELAQQVAHDIKNPLTPMKLSVQLLQVLYDKNPAMFEKKWKEIAPSLISQIDTISDVTSELNNFSKPSVKKEKVDLDECIKSAINVFANSDNNIKINYTSSTNYFVIGDKQLFVRIFNNLIKNATQSFKNNQANKHIDIAINTLEDKYIIISIKDNGSGIKDEDKSKIFDYRFTTKSNGGGIGLTIVKHILENYGATITFQSTENVGTTFFITFNKQIE